MATSYDKKPFIRARLLSASCLIVLYIVYGAILGMTLGIVISFASFGWELVKAIGDTREAALNLYTGTERGAMNLLWGSFGGASVSLIFMGIPIAFNATQGNTNFTDHCFWLKK